VEATFDETLVTQANARLFLSGVGLTAPPARCYYTT
jgi:hypothetical protein